MPIPLIAIASALAAGGTLVPHAAGGLIVTAVTGGYVAGTYLSTVAVTSVVTAATATLGVGVSILTGTAASIVGSAGIFGTTIGATGITGALMSVGILSSTPIAVPLLAGGALLGTGYITYSLFRLGQKLQAAKKGVEIQFSESEAKIIATIIKLLSKKAPGA